MRLSKVMGCLLLVFLVLLTVPQVYGAYTKSDPRFVQYNPGVGGIFSSTGTPVEREYCDAGQDFVLQLAPFGCSPTVVRSDLLEEQDVQVFCQIAATKINPLVSVSVINNVQLSGEYSSDVRDIGFHAQRKALGNSNAGIGITQPFLNNLGYAVIVLRQKKNASAMPDFVEGNITATLRYNLEDAYGIGRASFFLPQMTDRQWSQQKDQYGFWGARAFLRATDISENRARISVQTDKRELASFYIDKGKESSKVYLPGFDCLAGFKVKLDSLNVPERRARLNINGEIVQVKEGERFLYDKCRATSVEKHGVVESVSVTCDEDDDRTKFDLMISPKVKLSINGVEGEYQVGEKLNIRGEKTVYLGYVGTEEDSKNQENLFIYTFSMPDDRDKLTGEELRGISTLVSEYEYQELSGNDLVNFAANLGKNLVAWATNSFNYIVDGNSYNKIGYGETDSVEDSSVSVLGFKDAFDKTLDERVLDLFEKASADYNIILSSFAGTKYPAEAKLTKGEEAFIQLINMSYGTGQKRSAAELCAELKGDYPNSKALQELKTECNNPLLTANPERITQQVVINSKIKEISFQGVFDPKFEEYGAEVIVTGPNGMRKTINLRYEKPFYLEGMRDETQNTISQNEIITIPSEYDDQLEHDVHFRYREALPATWLWSFDKINWMNVSEMEVKGGKYDGWDLINIYGDLAVSLRVKNFSEGLTLVLTLKTKLKEKVLGITDKNSCEDCGEGALDFCTEKECNAIGEKIGKACQYVSSSRNCITPSGTSSTLTLTGNKPLGESIKINELDEEYAKIGTNFITSGIRDNVGNFLFSDHEERIKIGQTVDAGQGYKITLTNVNLKRVAKVTIGDDISRTETKASFPFKIGIEQRGIKLTPDEARKKIELLNETVAEFEEKSAKLGDIVKGMKTACLGTTAALMITNFLDNKDGKSIARREVMRGPNGWYERCARMVDNKENGYRTVNECLTKNSDAIEEEVKNWYGFQNTLNEEIKKIQSGCDKTNLLGENVVDDNCFLDGYVDSEYRNRLKSCLPRLDGDNDGIIEMQDDRININDFVDSLKRETVSIEEFRQLDLYCRVQGSEALNMISGARLNATLKDIYENTNALNQVNSIQTDAKNAGFSGASISHGEAKDATKVGWNGWTPIGNDIEGGGGYFESGKAYKAHIQSHRTSRYFFVLDGTSDKLDPIKVFKFEGFDSARNKIIVSEVKKSDGNIDQALIDEVAGSYKYVRIDPSMYENRYIQSYGTTYPVVRYFENEPNKGLPAIVPFDLDNGWYAAVKNTLPSFGAIQSYDESGKVRSFYLCNVGRNGIEENQGGDDICEMINTGTGMPYNQFSMLDPTKAEGLVRQAYSAIEVASKYHGQSSVPIGTKKIRVGEPATDIPDIQCYDFMSAASCKLLFNVCDPVICPASRCDLGGAYPVRDVVQTGIVGSVLLCSQNFVGFGGDVYIPVCLTGIKAGLDGWLSVHKSYIQCLQHGIDTGETIGICDEIYSLYKCEFFWRNAAPFAKLAVPKALEIIFGQNTRGGGEYLGVQTAWENTENSMKFFTDYYAENTFKAFQARATENVGGEVCKSYVSGVIPTGGAALDILTDPDSPPQFTGRFDEIPYTTVTNPPQSHYKVFFHIFSGKDRGAYYKVYLKGESDPYYQDINTRYLASGYIAKDSFVTNTTDFVAPSGYKQLCIVVNDQEECGFREVSTDFVVNYLSDQYIKNEAQRRNINSETDCVAGSRNLYSLVNPNIQEGANSALNPAIYNQGLIRICATKDPGAGSDPYAGGEKARWIKVGTCNANMACWLDTYSVKDIVKNANIRDDILSNQEDAAMQALADGPEYIQNLDAELEKIKTEKSVSKRIDLLTDIINNNRVFWSSEKAEVYMQRGNEYRDLVFTNYKALYENKTAANDTEEVEHGYSSPIFEFDDGVSGGVNIYYAFSKGTWWWSLDEEKWIETSQYSFKTYAAGQDREFTLSDTDKEFVDRYLHSKSYKTGLNALIKRTIEGNEPGWFRDFLGGEQELKTEMVTLKSDSQFNVNLGEDQFSLRNEIPEIPLAPVWKFFILPASRNDEYIEAYDEKLQTYLKDQKSKDLADDLIGTDLYAGAKIIFDINDRVSVGGETCPFPSICGNYGTFNSCAENTCGIPLGCIWETDTCVDRSASETCQAVTSCSAYKDRTSCEVDTCQVLEECMWQTDTCVENINSFSTVSPEFYIKDEGFLGTGFLADNGFYLVYNFKYAGDKGKWVASYDTTHTPSEDDKKFIAALEGLNYAGGLPLLMDKVFVDGDQLITDKVIFEDGVYRINFDDDLHIKSDNGWKWSVNGDDWFTIRDIDAGQPTLLDQRSISLLQSIKRQDNYGAVKTIFNVNLDLPLPTRDIAVARGTKPEIVFVVEERKTAEIKCVEPFKYFEFNMSVDYEIKNSVAPDVCRGVIEECPIATGSCQEMYGPPTPTGDVFLVENKENGEQKCLLPKDYFEFDMSVDYEIKNSVAPEPCKIISEADSGEVLLVEEKSTGEEKCILPKDIFRFDTSIEFEIRGSVAPGECNEIIGFDGGPDSITCSSSIECREGLGGKMIELANKIEEKYSINDADVKRDTGANSFECLALQIAMQESSIQHCLKVYENNDPLYCDGDKENIIRNVYGGDDYGIMQININANPSANVEVFADNVNYALEEVLIPGYSTTVRTYSCNGKSYSGWARALRGYNGWTSNCDVGDVEYVERVINKKSAVGNLFQECA